MAVILRATNSDGTVQDLDLFEPDPIRLDMSAIESGDIGSVFGVSSQTFQLPATEINQNFFGFLDNLGATPSVGLTKTLDCQVLFDGQEIFTGRMYVENIVTDQQGDTVYNVVVVNETVDFKYQIQNVLLQKSIDWSEYDHNLTYNNITSSWSGSLFNGDIVYPLINYGYDENNVTGSTQIVAGGASRNFDNNQYPLTLDYFKPTLKVKAVVDKIFEQTNYTYSSSFFDSADFNDIYVVATQDDKLGSAAFSPTSQSFQAYYQGIAQSITDNVATKIDFNTETFDNGNRYNGTDTYTAAGDGDYTFYTQVRYKITGATGPLDDILVLELYVNGVAQPNALAMGRVANTNAGTLFLGPVTIPLKSGDTVQVYATRTYDSIGGRVMTIESSTQKLTRFEGTSPTTVIGGNVNIGNIFDADTSAEDFLQGLIQKFNLVFEPVPTERNVISIEPFNTWVDNGKVVDWTDKVDREIKFGIRHPLQNQPRKIRFSDEEDSDVYNTEYTNRTGTQYGDYVYESDSDLAEGERNIGTYFASTPMGTVPGAPQMILPVLAQSKDGNVLTPYKYKPRLFYNLGLTDTSFALKGRDVAGGTNTYGGYFVKDENGIVHTLTQYSLFHHSNASPANFDTSKDLHFGNLNHTSFINNSQVKVKNSAFFEYWSFYINELYDIDARLLTCNVLLDPTELGDIRLNDKIFIDGAYYRINKISGANLMDEESVTVELLKTLPRKLYFPRRRIVYFKGDPDYAEGYKDVVLDFDDIIEGGTGQYRDYETGEIFTGSNDLGKVAPKDKFTVYGTSVVWDTLKPLQATFKNQTVLGNSQADSSADKINVVGDNNFIGSSVIKSNIVGDNNTISGLNEYISIDGTFNTVQRNISDITVINGFNNTITSGSANVALLGAYQNEIVSSSISNQVGGIQTDIKYSNASNTFGGRNLILSSSVDTITIGGNGETYTGFNGNTIIGATGIVPDDNFTGSDYRGGTNILWDSYMEGGMYLNRESLQLQLQNGDTYPAYSGNALYKYVYAVDFDYLTAGTGSATIELPTIVSQQQQGRSILFKASPNINPTRKIIISSFGGTDTIEGKTQYVLNTPNQWVELQAGTFPDASIGGFVTEWRVIRASQNAAYGSFYATGSQTLDSPDVSQSVLLGGTSLANGVSTTGSRIYIDKAGVYEFNYIAQVQNTDSTVHNAAFWIKYNGNDYPNSTTYMSLRPRKSATEPQHQLMTAQFIGQAQNDNDYIELYWAADSTQLSLFATGSGAIDGAPATPSVIANIKSIR